ncbi:uncharacterized protein LOC131689733 [Topomyia yanbarensis]|uniref:uncharacterized protein LOC131689733 n=1 Tax=Topomyia yanbarensis TaxID=2498891 RepID=UPI00273B2DBD|nr:uncharacterized protein LOC131689733 [Topomyia yanbarensis]XP_058831008.1 uncharacterized protein LOC131689733 [Topomyia yanbarensis]
MEIRWYWIALSLLIVVSHTAVTHDMTNSRDSSSSNYDIGSSKSSSSSNAKDKSNISKKGNTVNISNNLEELSSVPYHTENSQKKNTVSSAHKEYDADDNFDELIASTEAIATKNVKKYLQKDYKHHKKYYPNDGDRQTPEYANDPLVLNENSRESSAREPQLVDAVNKPHSRKKRLIWITDDGRMAFPPGTSLTIAPTIALPFVRYPPTGFLSNISISLPVTIDFDKLGLTDNQNPLGVLPPLFARSMGRAAGSVLADYVSDYMHNRRRKRSASNFQSSDMFKITTNFIDGDGSEPKTPELPEEHKHAFHGGERALLYTVVEDFIANFGLDGKACMLRAICEVHSKPVENFGLIGEILRLFFTASLSPYSEHLQEYVSAENIGKGQSGPGECFPYFKDCPKSLFRTTSKFQQRFQSNSPSEQNAPDDLYENSIDDLEREIRGTGERESQTQPKDETVMQLDSGWNKLVM